MRGEGASGRAWTALWLAVALVGIAALATGWVLTRGVEQRVLALDREAAGLRASLARDQAFLGMLRDPATRLIPLAGTGPSPGARGQLVWNAPAGGLLLVAGLPPASPGTAYQLWALAGTQPPVPVGVFTVDLRGAGSLRLSPLPEATAVEGFVVTLETAGGSQTPSGPRHLAGKP